MRHLELFAGIGGFRRAMDILTNDHIMEFHCIGYSEIDSKAEATYRSNYAIGKDENYSKVFRLTTTFTKDGANDISEFVKPENPYAYSASEGTLNIPAHNPKVVMYKTKSE